MTADIEHDLASSSRPTPPTRRSRTTSPDGARRRARAQVKRQRGVAVLACAAVAPCWSAASPCSSARRPITRRRRPPAARMSAAFVAFRAVLVRSVVPEKPALYFHNVEVPVPAAMLTGRVRTAGSPSRTRYVLDARRSRAGRIVPRTER